MMNDQDSKPQKIPHLTESYQKSRRNYALFSGLLFAWELIGVRMDKKPFNQFNVELINPDATPYILLALIAYFAYRVIIEWHQCDARRRAKRASCVDFITAHSLAGAAVLCFLLPQVWDNRLADLAPGLLFRSLVFAIIAGTNGWLLHHGIRARDLSSRIGITIFGLAGAFIWIVSSTRGELLPEIVITSYGLGLLLGEILRFRRRRRPSSQE